MVATRTKPRVVVIGSGWAGFRFICDVDRRRFDVFVVSPRDHFVFTPLLASTTVGTIAYEAIIEPVRGIPNITFYEAKVLAVQSEQKSVQCQDTTTIFADERKRIFNVSYDYLVVAPGAKAQTYGISGVEEHALFLKQIDDARKIRMRIMNLLERAAQPALTDEDRKRILSIAVVGGGPASVEFTSELFDFVTEDVTKIYGPELASEVTITLIEAGKTILSSFDPSIGEYAMETFKKRKIAVRTGVPVKAVTQHSVDLADGTSIATNMTVWSTGVAPLPLIESMDCPKHAKNGRILVDEHLGIRCMEGVFAIGDCAVNGEGFPRPCIASVAEQHAIYLSKLFNTYLGTLPIVSHDQIKTKSFEYNEASYFAYVGGWNATAALKDHEHKWAKWFFLRPLHWSSCMSVIHKIVIPLYWLKAWTFGRSKTYI